MFLYNILPEYTINNDTKTDIGVLGKIKTLKGYTEAIDKEVFEVLSDSIREILTFMDIDKIQIDYLPYLSYMLGYEWNYYLNSDIQKKLLKNILEIYKRKGTKFSFHFNLYQLDPSVSVYEPYKDIFVLNKSSMNRDIEFLKLWSKTVDNAIKVDTDNDGNIYILTNNTIEKFDTNKNKIWSIEESENIIDMSIKHISIQKDVLYYATTNIVKKIDLNKNLLGIYNTKNNSEIDYGKITSISANNTDIDSCYVGTEGGILLEIGETNDELVAISSYNFNLVESQYKIESPVINKIISDSLYNVIVVLSGFRNGKESHNFIKKLTVKNEERNYNQSDYSDTLDYVFKYSDGIDYNVTDIQYNKNEIYFIINNRDLINIKDNYNSINEDFSGYKFICKNFKIIDKETNEFKIKKNWNKHNDSVYYRLVLNKPVLDSSLNKKYVISQINDDDYTVEYEYSEDANKEDGYDTVVFKFNNLFLYENYKIDIEVYDRYFLNSDIYKDLNIEYDNKTIVLNEIEYPSNLNLYLKVYKNGNEIHDYTFNDIDKIVVLNDELTENDTIIIKVMQYDSNNLYSYKVRIPDTELNDNIYTSIINNTYKYNIEDSNIINVKEITVTKPADVSIKNSMFEEILVNGLDYRINPVNKSIEYFDKVKFDDNININIYNKTKTNTYNKNKFNRIFIKEKDYPRDSNGLSIDVYINNVLCTNGVEYNIYHDLKPVMVEFLVDIKTTDVITLDTKTQDNEYIVDLNSNIKSYTLSKYNKNVYNVDVFFNNSLMSKDNYTIKDGIVTFKNEITPLDRVYFVLHYKSSKDYRLDNSIYLTKDEFPIYSELVGVVYSSIFENEFKEELNIDDGYIINGEYRIEKLYIRNNEFIKGISTISKLTVNDIELEENVNYIYNPNDYSIIFAIPLYMTDVLKITTNNDRVLTKNVDYTFNPNTLEIDFNDISLINGVNIQIIVFEYNRELVLAEEKIDTDYISIPKDLYLGLRDKQQYRLFLNSKELYKDIDFILSTDINNNKYNIYFIKNGNIDNKVYISLNDTYKIKYYFNNDILNTKVITLNDTDKYNNEYIINKNITLPITKLPKDINYIKFGFDIFINDKYINDNEYIYDFDTNTIIFKSILLKNNDKIRIIIYNNKYNMYSLGINMNNYNSDYITLGLNNCIKIYNLTGYEFYSINTEDLYVKSICNRLDDNLIYYITGNGNINFNFIKIQNGEILTSKDYYSNGVIVIRINNLTPEIFELMETIRPSGHLLLIEGKYNLFYNFNDKLYKPIDMQINNEFYDIYNLDKYEFLPYIPNKELTEEDLYRKIYTLNYLNHSYNGYDNDTINLLYDLKYKMEEVPNYGENFLSSIEYSDINNGRVNSICMLGKTFITDNQITRYTLGNVFDSIFDDIILSDNTLTNNKTLFRNSIHYTNGIDTDNEIIIDGNDNPNNIIVDIPSDFEKMFITIVGAGGSSSSTLKINDDSEISTGGGGAEFIQNLILTKRELTYSGIDCSNGLQLKLYAGLSFKPSDLLLNGEDSYISIIEKNSIEHKLIIAHGGESADINNKDNSKYIAGKGYIGTYRAISDDIDIKKQFSSGKNGADIYYLDNIVNSDSTLDKLIFVYDSENSEYNVSNDFIFNRLNSSKIYATAGGTSYNMANGRLDNDNNYGTGGCYNVRKGAGGVGFIKLRWEK